MTALASICLKLDSEYVHGYGPSPLPNEIDNEVEQLIDASFRATGGDTLVAELTETHGLVLLAYAERMASLAVREGRVDIVSRGMKALHIASRLVDEKELLPILALLHNSATMLGADWPSLIPATPGFGENRFKESCERFLARTDADRSIQAMGYIESEEEGGFRYIRTW